MRRLRPLTESECYARCYGGDGDESVRVVRVELRKMLDTMPQVEAEFARTWSGEQKTQWAAATDLLLKSALAQPVVALVHNLTAGPGAPPGGVVGEGGVAGAVLFARIGYAALYVPAALTGGTGLGYFIYRQLTRNPGLL